MNNPEIMIDDKLLIMPMTPEVALRLGQYPCKFCDFIWGGQDSEGTYQNCQETCSYYKAWLEMTHD